MHVGQHQWTYGQYRDDLAAAYTNSRFPYLVAVLKFRMPKQSYPRDFDAAKIAMPKGLPPGHYILQYHWKGTFDCYDILHLREPATDKFGKRAPGMAVEKVDHCQFRDYTFNQGKCTLLNSNQYGNDTYQIQQVLDSVNIFKTDAINVVPVKNPPMVRFQDDINIPYHHPQLKGDALRGSSGPRPELHFDRWSCRQDVVEAEANSYSLVAYPITYSPNKPEVGDRYVVSNDPRDPVFYSTCYILDGRVGNTFANDPELIREAEGESPLTFRPDYIFGDQFLSCDEAKRNACKQKHSLNPVWWDIEGGAQPIVNHPKVTSWTGEAGKRRRGVEMAWDGKQSTWYESSEKNAWTQGTFESESTVCEIQWSSPEHKNFQSQWDDGMPGSFFSGIDSNGNTIRLGNITSTNNQQKSMQVSERGPFVAVRWDGDFGFRWPAGEWGFGWISEIRLIGCPLELPTAGDCKQCEEITNDWTDPSVCKDSE